MWARVPNETKPGRHDEMYVMFPQRLQVSAFHYD